VEQVINALLENNLPVFPNDEPADEDEEEFDYANFVPPNAEETAFSSELSQRKNVYDNDDFDVFNKTTVDLSKIYLGKK
jgi:hypothetical protein